MNALGNNRFFGLSRNRILSRWLMLLCSVLTVIGAGAGTIADSPLFLDQAVIPNIILVLDDSGSMDSEVLMPTNDGALWWRTDDKQFVGRNGDDVTTPAQVAAGLLNFNKLSSQSNPWMKYVYLFPNGTATGNRQYADAGNDHFAVPPLPKYAFMRSPAYNRAYFNPAATYEPWKSYGTTYSNVTATSAPSDPARGTYRFGLTSNIENSSSNFTFKVQSGMTIPSGTRYASAGGSFSAAPVAGVSPGSATDYGISYYPATFYLPHGTALPTGYGYTATPLVGYAPDGTTALDGYEIKTENFSSTAAYNASMQNFANWFTYYRKRHAAARGSIGAAFEEITKVRVGSFKINSLTAVTMRDMSSTTDRTTLFTDIYNNYVGGSGTPNRQAMKYAGDQFMRTNTGAPIQYACQRNAAILLTDGFALADTSSGVGNADGSSGSPYADTVSNTMADISMYFYNTNLRPTFATGKVRVKKACDDPSPDAWLDCNKNLHMNSYAVTVGTRGILFNPDAIPAQDPYTSAPSWPTAFPDRHPSAVDDLWHATINGRGKLFNANAPAEIVDRLRSILQDFIEKEGSAAAAATNSTRVDTGNEVFQAKFNSGDWTGQLLAFPLDSNGTYHDADANGVLDDSDAAWDAADKMPSAGTRNILSYDPTKVGAKGIEFQWGQLNATQQSDLFDQDVVNYLRGDRTNERPSGTYRKREKLLGDIVNSDPAFVGPETYGYQTLASEGATYAAFVSTTKRNRKRMVYAGANDGMLHGFRVCAPTDGVCSGTVATDDGKELMAYVPSSVIHNQMASLADDAYNHRYFVDGAAKAGDAFINSAWRTVLLGSTGAGGRNVFALDVTNPDAIDATKVMWEFTDSNDTDLGYTLPQPSIVRMYDGHWAALIANGYNSTNGRAVLFILNLQDGSLLQKIDTGAAGNTLVAKNGLSTPLAVDVPRDVDGDGNVDPADKIVDYIYAGDLVGNLWKFDVTSASASSWSVAGGTSPLFVACTSATTPCSDANRQPITAKAQAIAASAEGQSGGLMILFGTGKYFEDGDNLVPGDPQMQSLYGLWDAGVTIAGRNDLQAQTIDAEATLGGYEVRVTSQNSVGYPTKKGWYMDLRTSAGTKQGERVVSAPLLDGKRIAFVTMMPIADPCSYGGTSWIMDLSAMGGQQAKQPVWDIYGSGGKSDGKFDNYDKVTVNGVSKAPSGKKSTIGILKTPAVVKSGGKKFWYFSGSAGGLNQESKPLDQDGGRQTWIQLR